ncbi:MAG: flavodoxin-dependent (E)-4-hydroxy-3-methylbut-2-enyl-diphosphate synthase, partial [Clostridia bacterium]|nr:flavodoxin-dependent (E)-4-hydroxy-3-methylbut-2-enyl-diphosphate synthase [Clostridia bacterium]
MFTRNETKVVRIGDVTIGGGNKIAVQSMTNTKTHDVAATVAQINALTDLGCEIVRVAVADMTDAEAIADIKKEIKIPLVADIHFDYRLAVAAIQSGADKIRLNPGNIGGEENVKTVATLARERGVPIRIGVNGGSLEKELLKKYGVP